MDPVIPLVQGKVHEQRPKHGSDSSEPRCFDLFWPPNVDSLRWIIFHHCHQTLGMAYFWWPCGWFLKLSDIIPSSQFRKVHGFIHLESSPIISDLWTDVSNIFSSRCRWSRWTKAPPCYLPRGHQSREMFLAVFKSYAGNK